VRVHQEDLCQSLAVPPTRKYQNEGGPGIKDIVEALRTHSSARDEDVATFIDAIAFNWLIAGPDAHAKNYSLLIGAGPRVRLAPLYDIASILPYDGFDLHKVKLAMKIGGEYDLRQIGSRQWQKLAQEVRIDSDQLLLRLREMAEQLPDEASAACKQAHQAGLNKHTFDRLTAELIKRAGECRQMFAKMED
jgi:serine/threonine-protein kinase HipA